MKTKSQSQDIESRLRELTERTRRTRHELEELIYSPETERAMGLAHDTPPFFRRRKSREEK